MKGAIDGYDTHTHTDIYHHTYMKCIKAIVGQNIWRTSMWYTYTYALTFQPVEYWVKLGALWKTTSMYRFNGHQKRAACNAIRTNRNAISQQQQQRRQRQRQPTTIKTCIATSLTTSAAPHFEAHQSVPVSFWAPCHMSILLRTCEKWKLHCKSKCAHAHIHTYRCGYM